MQGWYNRVENNGWRPLADRLLLEDRNLGARDTKILSKITYQPFAVLRKEERKRIMKQRKVEWYVYIWMIGLLRKGKKMGMKLEKKN